MTALRLISVLLSAAAHVGLIVFFVTVARHVAKVEAEAPIEVSVQDIPEQSDNAKPESNMAVPVLRPEAPEQTAKINESPFTMATPDDPPIVQPSGPPETAAEINAPAAGKPSEPLLEHPLPPPPSDVPDPAPKLEQRQPSPVPIVRAEEPAFAQSAEPPPMASISKNTQTELKANGPSEPLPPKPVAAKKILPEIGRLPIPSAHPNSPSKPKIVAALPEPSHDVVSAPSVAHPGVHASENNPNIRAAFLASLSARLRSRMVFPPGAPAGLVVVHFAIDRTGSVLSRQVIKSSGSKQLDDAALDMVARAAPFPAMPDGLAGQRLEVTQPLNFRGR